MPSRTPPRETSVSPSLISQSVIAVPPLARDADLRLDEEGNRNIIEYLERGGIRTLLYGGNANLYHVRLGEYEGLLRLLLTSASPQTWVIPSVGPAYGMMMEQAEVLRDFPFPTVMLLPQKELTTPAGIALAVRHFTERLGRPIVLYVKHEGWIDVATVARMVQEEMVCMIKYAVVLPDPAQDPWLRSLVDQIDPRMIVSGMGEQPAIVHWRDFRLGGFTSGCVCVAPTMSMELLRALQRADFDEAERMRRLFRPLEDLRNNIHPIRVLHAAVELAGIALTGPMLPLLSDIDSHHRPAIQDAVHQLLAEENIAARAKVTS